jgi:urease accessory protein
MRRQTLPTAAAALLALASPALAHTGHNASFAVVDGVLHPFAGMDHLLAMLAVGFWAALIGGRAVVALPVTFVSAMVLGALAASSGLTTGGIEAGIVGSVIVLGAAIALRLNVPLAVAVGVTAIFAVAHGQAHGLEVPDGASLAAYVGGFALATSALHLGGVAMGRMLARMPVLSRAIGAAVSAAGIALAAS